MADEIAKIAESERLKFSKKEAFQYGWKTFKKYPAFLVAITLLSGIVSYGPNWLTQQITNHGQNPNSFLTFIIFIIGFVAQLIIGMGIINVAIKLTEDKKPDWDDLYFQYPKVWNYFLASVLYGLVVLGGLILLIVPGIYFAIKYQFYSYLIVNKNVGPLESLKQSSTLTKGSTWNLFIFGILSALIVLCGLIIFLVGALVAQPVIFIAAAYVYKKLSAAAK